MSIIISFLSLLISISVLLVMLWNYKINKTKLDLDLYNRRFKVFESSLEYYLESCSKDHLSKEKKDDFTRAYREARFLFGEDSDVYRCLSELKDCIARTNESNGKDENYLALKALEDELVHWIDFREVGVKKPRKASIKTLVETMHNIK